MTETTSFQTLLGLPVSRIDSLEGASVVVIGASEATPYDAGSASHSAGAPAAIRAASAVLSRQLAQFDFDLGATMLPEKGAYRGMVDCGDVPTRPAEAESNRRRITAAVSAVLDAGAAPVVLGGDDSVPIPVLQAFERHGPVFIVQVDAHVDWADTIRGQSLGYGSPMRRVAEMPWVTGMVQVGIRGLGSGESWQHDDARSWGSRIVTSYQLHEKGLEAVLRHVPEGARVVFSIDCDGMDPAFFPAVAMPTPGGLTYEDMIRLFRGVAAKAEIAGFILAEYVPDHDDHHRLCALTAARLVGVAMGLMLKAGPAG